MQLKAHIYFVCYNRNSNQFFFLCFFFYLRFFQLLFVLVLLCICDSLFGKCKFVEKYKFVANGMVDVKRENIISRCSGKRSFPRCSQYHLYARFNGFDQIDFQFKFHSSHFLIFKLSVDKRKQIVIPFRNEYSIEKKLLDIWSCCGSFFLLLYEENMLIRFVTIAIVI